MGELPGVSELVGVVLWLCRAGALACAHLRLALARFRLGASRDISLGGVAIYRHPNFREDYLRHFVFRFVDSGPIDGIRAARLWFSRTGPPHDRLAGPAHSGKIPEQRGSLARAGGRGGIRGRRDSITPLSRTNLIGLQTNNQGENLCIQPLKPHAKPALSIWR